ncbi:MAG: hypothetical protein HY719_00305 [Planctomycetes bacterium]|nr:hypothetical protein [Planctomycetota bacterium]
MTVHPPRPPSDSPAGGSESTRDADSDGAAPAGAAAHNAGAQAPPPSPGTPGEAPAPPPPVPTAQAAGVGGSALAAPPPGQPRAGGTTAGKRAPSATRRGAGPNVKEHAGLSFAIVPTVCGLVALICVAAGVAFVFRASDGDQVGASPGAPAKSSTPAPVFPPPEAPATGVAAKPDDSKSASGPSSGAHALKTYSRLRIQMEPEPETKGRVLVEINNEPAGATSLRLDGRTYRAREEWDAFVKALIVRADRNAAGRPILREENGLSTAVVTLRVGSDAQYRYVQRIIQECALNAKLRIWKLRFEAPEIKLGFNYQMPLAGDPAEPEVERDIQEITRVDEGEDGVERDIEEITRVDEGEGGGKGAPADRSIGGKPRVRILYVRETKLPEIMINDVSAVLAHPKRTWGKEPPSQGKVDPSPEYEDACVGMYETLLTELRQTSLDFREKMEVDASRDCPFLHVALALHTLRFSGTKKIFFSAQVPD